MESFTNGGLILIKEKMEDNPNYFFQSTSFLNLILDSKLGKKQKRKKDDVDREE